MIELVPNVKQDRYDQSSELKRHFRLIKKSDLVLRASDKCRHIKSRLKQS